MKNCIPLLTIVLVFFINGCSKKSIPLARPAEVIKTDTTASIVVNTDSVVAPRLAPIKIKRKAAIPKVITVSDAGARKSVDGRLYYDLQGHRYWRNYKDGKYYLFNQSMNTDPAFKKPN